MLGLYNGQNVAGATFPSEIWHTYMTEAKGKFCGDFPPPKTPFSSQPFFGRYTSSGGKGNPSEGGTTDDSTTDSSTPVAPVTPQETPEDTGDAEEPDVGQGGDDEGFDPDKYEAPPQPDPGGGDGNNGNGNGDGDGGGTQAPG
jgi:penicillin-binding protein 1A